MELFFFFINQHSYWDPCFFYNLSPLLDTCVLIYKNIKTTWLLGTVFFLSFWHCYWKLCFSLLLLHFIGNCFIFHNFLQLLREMFFFITFIVDWIQSRNGQNWIRLLETLWNIFTNISLNIGPFWNATSYLDLSWKLYLIDMR